MFFVAGRSGPRALSPAVSSRSGIGAGAPVNERRRLLGFSLFVLRAAAADFMWLTKWFDDALTFAPAIVLARVRNSCPSSTCLAEDFNSDTFDNRGVDLAAFPFAFTPETVERSNGQIVSTK